MPAWTLGDLASEATKFAGYRSDLALSDVSRLVNQAYSEVAQAANHKLLESKTIFSVNSGTSILALPADHLETINISLSTNLGSGSNRTLEPTTSEWADARGYYPVGEPMKYFEYGTSIQLWPSANSSANTTVSSGRSYEMRYRARATDLVATGDVPSVDTEWRWAILLRTEALVHKTVGNRQEAAEAQTEYFTYVSSLKDAQARRQMARGRFALSLPQRKSRRGPNSPSGSCLNNCGVICLC